VKTKCEPSFKDPYGKALRALLWRGIGYYRSASVVIGVG